MGDARFQGMVALEAISIAKPKSLEELAAIEEWKDAVCRMFELEEKDEAVQLIKYGRLDSKPDSALERLVELFEKHGERVVPILRGAGLADHVKAGIAPKKSARKPSSSR